MENRKRKLYHIFADMLCATLALMLCACAAEAPVDNNWSQQLSNTLNEKNYTVEIKTTQKNIGDPVFRWLGAYDGPSHKSHIESTDDKGKTSDIYYAAENGHCTTIEWDNDRHIRIKKETAFDNKLFEACHVTERIKHFGTLIDQNKLTYDATTHCYTGSDNLGDYIVNQKTHHIRSLEIKIREDRVLDFKEVYETEMNGEKTVCTDEVCFENIGKTKIDLPENTFTEAEAEERAAFSENTSAMRDDISQKIQALNTLSDAVEKQQQIAKEKQQAREAYEQERNHLEIDKTKLHEQVTAWIQEIRERINEATDCEKCPANH